MVAADAVPIVNLLDDNIGLYADLYELTMAQAYFREGRHEARAAFDYHFRKNPFGGGFTLFAGLETLLDALADLRFGPEALGWLERNGFRPDFLAYLETFRFRGDVYAHPEGEPVFPFEPIVRVDGGMLEAQLVESMLLNFLNFESLIATKAARIRSVSGDRVCSEFGLRRGQGLGAIQAARAAIVGGFDSTSNVYAAFAFDVPAAGTMAHSYIESHPDELSAFRAFAAAYPDRCILLVDTYSTLESGVPNAITVARELAAQGHRMRAIRLDSGDLGALAHAARRMLDDAGFRDVKLVASNQLDEFVIRDLLAQGAPIDIFGVGTRLTTGRPDAALDGVYKLAMADGEPRLKLSETPEKITLPGIKQVYRLHTDRGEFAGDVIGLATEGAPGEMLDLRTGEAIRPLRDVSLEPLLRPVMREGRRTDAPRPLPQIAAYARARLASLPAPHRTLTEPQPYPLGLSRELHRLRGALIEKHRSAWTRS